MSVENDAVLKPKMHLTSGRGHQGYIYYAKYYGSRREAAEGDWTLGKQRKIHTQGKSEECVKVYRENK